MVCGLEQVLPKVGRHYQLLAELTGRPVVLYTQDSSGHSGEVAADYDLEWIPVPRGTAADLLRFQQILRQRRPAHVELYHAAQNVSAHLGYLVIAEILKVPTVLICRGGEVLYWGLHTTYRRAAYRFGFRRAPLIVYKELHMPQRLESLGVPAHRLYFLYNRVPFDSTPPLPITERLRVVYVNSWKSWRRPDIALEVAIRLSPKYPHVRFVIAGERPSGSDREVGEKLRRRLAESGVAERVALLPFVRNVRELLDTAAVFLLPAELVFLNYGLLEAMERGLVPIVANAEGADRVVTDGYNGQIVELSTDGFSAALDGLLSDVDRMAEMAVRARETIREHFELRSGLDELVREYEQRVWCKP